MISRHDIRFTFADREYNDQDRKGRIILWPSTDALSPNTMNALLSIKSFGEKDILQSETTKSPDRPAISIEIFFFSIIGSTLLYPCL